MLFTADTHFGHGGALGLFRRPFPSVVAMDEALVKAWNAAVAPADTVWHLGDFAVRASADRVADLLGRLNGTKHLIAGNNDGETARACAGWASVRDYAELTDDETGRRLVLCHYPLRSWNGMGKGAINLHGHCHGRMAPLTRQFDVGVDARDFRPVTAAALLVGGRRSRQAASGSSVNSSSGRRTPRSA